MYNVYIYTLKKKRHIGRKLCRKVAVKKGRKGKNVYSHFPVTLLPEVLPFSWSCNALKAILFSLCHEKRCININMQYNTILAWETVLQAIGSVRRYVLDVLVSSKVIIVIKVWLLARHGNSWVADWFLTIRSLHHLWLSISNNHPFMGYTIGGTQKCR